jgi:hypothetical protein
VKEVLPVLELKSKCELLELVALVVLPLSHLSPTSVAAWAPCHRCKSAHIYSTLFVGIISELNIY